MSDLRRDVRDAVDEHLDDYKLEERGDDTRRYLVVEWSPENDE